MIIREYLKKVLQDKKNRFSLHIAYKQYYVSLVWTKNGDEMMDRRNSYDVLYDILTVAKNPSVKTKLVYGSNLNFEIIKDYITDLTENGLIETDGKKYTTTDKGMTYIRMKNNLDHLFLK